MLYNNLDNYDDAIGADVIALQVQIFERLWILENIADLLSTIFP